jgi:beta-fructofuranosidase
VKGDTVIEQPPGMDLVGFRDPFLRRDPDAWRAFLGAGDTDGDALALSYTSQDLQTWTYEGIALQRPSADRDPVWMGAMWECPQIFDLDGRHVMLSSAWDRDVLNYAGYAVGRYDRGVFTAEAWGRLTYGPSYYAPSFFRDADGRAAISLWMRGIEDLEAGWAGAHSIPYVLSLSGDVLVATPHPDLDAYLAPPSADGHVPGTAADIRWTGGGTAEVRSGGTTLFSLDGTGDAVVLTIGDTRWEIPRRSGQVRIIVDASSLEVITDQGVHGHAIPVHGNDLDAVGDGMEVRALVRTGSA